MLNCLFAIILLVLAGSSDDDSENLQKIRENSDIYYQSQKEHKIPKSYGQCGYETIYYNLETDSALENPGNKGTKLINDFQTNSRYDQSSVREDAYEYITDEFRDHDNIISEDNDLEYSIDQLRLMAVYSFPDLPDVTILRYSFLEECYFAYIESENELLPLSANSQEKVIYNYNRLFSTIKIANSAIRDCINQLLLHSYYIAGLEYDRFTLTFCYVNSLKEIENALLYTDHFSSLGINSFSDEHFLDYLEVFPFITFPLEDKKLLNTLDSQKATKSKDLYDKFFNSIQEILQDNAIDFNQSDASLASNEFRYYLFFMNLYEYQIEYDNSGQIEQIKLLNEIDLDPDSEWESLGD